MEEIVTLCGHSELYDITSYLLRDRTKKEIAWRKVSEEVGLPGKFCIILIHLLQLIHRKMCLFWVHTAG